MKIEHINKERWPDVEGELNLICGPIGGGKTYTATVKILEALAKGIPVFCSYPIKFDGINPEFPALLSPR